MKQIILERNIEYAIWENIIYVLVVLVGLFFGTTFLSSGQVAFYTSLLSGFLIVICICSLLTKKGLVHEQELYRGYFLFSKLLYRKKVENPVSNKFTILHKRYRQKYIRLRNEFDWEYAVDSFELYFFDEDGAIQNWIIKCMKEESSEKARIFLVENCGFEFVSL